MNFTIYDVISHLVPGYVILFFFRQDVGLEIKDMESLGVVALAYAIGYIIQALSSWFEGVLFFTWGGKPSDQLLNGKDMWKVRCHSLNQTKNHLISDAAKSGQQIITNDALFEIAYRLVNSKKLDRVINFNASYAFARSLTLAFFAVLVRHLFVSPFNLKVVTILLTLLLVSWYRAKQRGFYFAREVLNMYTVERASEVVTSNRFEGDGSNKSIPNNESKKL